MFFKDEESRLKQQQQELMQKMKEEERERRLKIDEMTINVFDKLSTYLDAKELEKEVPETKQELLTLNTNYTQVDTEGYSYTYFIVQTADAGTVLTADVLGIMYTLTLTEGLNRLNVIDGTSIKTSVAVSGVIVRTNKKLD